MKPKPTKQVTTAIMLEKRMPRKDGHYPVKLRVTSERKQKFYTIRYVPEKIGDDFTEYQKFWSRKVDKSISMNEQEFKKIRKENPPEPYKTMAIYIQTQEKEAQDTIAAIKQFTFERFEGKYFAQEKDDQDIFAAIVSKAEALRKDGKIGTAVLYENTISSLKDFTKKDNYPFGSVTTNFLKEYETWMLTPRTIKVKIKGKEKEKEKKNSKTTASIYLRCLRAIFNESAPEDTSYPFGKGKYTIPKWNHNKRALTQADVSKIAGRSVIDGSMEHRSRDLWLFSYLCNGMNFKDIANLKYSNIKGDTIVFERAKTAKSGNEVMDITVIITPQIDKIIDKWGCNPRSQDQFIFDILQNGMTAEEQHRTIKQMVKNTNKYMRRICSALEIPEATTYVARHSFATVLKRSGASVEYISESLGHKNISTTQNYLADFEIEEKRKWAEKLANF